MTHEGVDAPHATHESGSRAGFRLRALALCILVAIPIVIVELRNARQAADTGIADARERAAELRDTAKERYEDILLQAQTVLDFTAVNTKAGLTGPACDGFMNETKSRYDYITGLALLAPDGRVLCGSTGSRGLSFAQEPNFRKAVATRKLAESGFHIGLISHKPIISLNLPILDDAGVVRQLVGIGVSLEKFSSQLGIQRLGKDISVTIFDSAGTVIARYPEPEKFLGRSMADHPLFRKIAAEGTGEYQGPSLDGIQKIMSFRPFQNGSSFIAVGLPEAPILARVHDHLVNNLLVVLLFGLALTLIGVGVSEFLIFQPARQVTRAARALGEGNYDIVPTVKSAMPEIANMLAAFRDMAGRLAQREAELKHSEAAAQSYTRNLLLGEQISNAGYWRLDVATEAVVWSEGIYRIFGLDSRSYTPTVDTAIALYHPDDRNTVLEAVELAIAFGRDYEQTLRILRPDGEVRHMLSRGFCELGPTGEIQALFGAVMDVTVQKETEARLLAASKQAEAANRAKSDFLSSMSHELRTPLTSIIGVCDLLLMRTRSAETGRYLKLQREAGQHLLALINDILDHSKIEAGKLELESIPFSLRAVIRSCHDVMGHEARQRGLALDSTVDTTVPDMLVGDPARLKQVLLNLVGNALKFTRQGHVGIQVEPAGAAGDIAALRFCVTDTGVGIDPGRIHTLFTRFSQADASVTREFGGTGLGLSISRDLVQAMGGAIGVESTLGGGSAFWFTLRLPTTASVEPLAGAPVISARGASRILLAEDSPVNQLLFSELLQALGHQVVTVGDGAAAVEAARDGEFDLVLMDMQMPVMDGLSATRAIHRLPGAAVPIVGLTANAMKEDVASCLAAGMNAHLPKPVDLASLVETIGRLTGEGKTGEACPVPSDVVS